MDELTAAGITDPDLRASYEECKRLNALHGKTYYLATLLLPKAKRPFVHALYGFARYADEIVDDLASELSVEEKSEVLSKWGNGVLADLKKGTSQDHVGRALIDTVNRFDIPHEHFEAFLHSMTMDLTVQEYENYDDLIEYVYGSAAVIGLEMVPILGPMHNDAFEAAKKLGIKATVYMPIGASLPKVEATRNYGARVVQQGGTFAECLKAAQEEAKNTGAIFIPPFDHIDVVLGQGTVGLEILQQHPDVSTIVVAIGGGGLAAGVAVAAKLAAAAQGRKIKVIGVQSEHAAAYPASLRAGKVTEIQTTPTIADGIAVSKPGRVPFELIKKYVDKVVTVSENDIAKAILVLLERAKQVVEPAGAVAVAALMSGKAKPKGKTVAILSGGNMDPLLLQRVIRHGLSTSDRYTNFSVMLPDRPGQLALTAEVIAGAHANVIEVLHTRHGNGLQISEVELNLSVETSGHNHRMEVVKALEKAGLRPKLQPSRED
jgi:threonine dehydratase